MTSDLDMYRGAKLLIDRHGDDAAVSGAGGRTKHSIDGLLPDPNRREVLRVDLASQGIIVVR